MPSEVQTFQDNIDQVTSALLSTRIAVATGINALSIAEGALSALKKIDTNATALESLASGLETGLALVSRLSGPLEPFAKLLKRAIDVVEDRAAEVAAAADAAKPPDSQFSTILNLVKAEKFILETELALIDAQVQELGSITAGLSDAVAVVENTDGMDIPTAFDSAIAGANATVVGINLGYQPIIDALDTLATARQNVANALNGIIEPGRVVLNALYKITNALDGLDFLSGPISVLQDVLSPIKWALDAISIVYDNTIGLVVNPIIDGLGITQLFSDMLSSIGLDLDNLTVDILPSIDIFPDFGDPLDDLVANLQADVIDPLIGALRDLQDQIIGTDLLGPVNNVPGNESSLVIGDDDNPPNDPPGTEVDAMGGDDLVAGGLGNDTLSGGAGDDLLIGGWGDDVIDGGDGYDGAVFFGSWMDYRFAYGNDGELIATQNDYTGGRQGTDRLFNIEKVIFSDRSFDIMEFENFFYTNSTAQVADSVAGNDDANYVFGNIGRDTLFGEGGNDYLFGGRGNADYSGGRNTLFGGDGDDLLDGGTFLWNDYFGGDGNDTVSYETYGANGSGNSILYLALTNDIARIPFSPEFYETYTSIESLTNGESIKSWMWGDGGNNVLTGGGLQDRINGFAGNDTIIAGEGKDQLVGGAGDDYVDGGEGRNLFIAGPGNDTYIHQGNAAHELWYGGISETSNWNQEAYNWRSVENSETVETNDDFVRLRVMGILEDDVPTQIPARVMIDAAAGVVEKYNAAGASMGLDTLISIDTLTASQGNDTLTGATFATELSGGGGDDLFIGVDQPPQTEEDQPVYGTLMAGDAGNDTFRPGLGTTSIGGGDGNDRVEMTKDGFVGFDGGAGRDIADFSGSERAWDFNPDLPIRQAQGFTPGDTRNAGEYADVDEKSIRNTEEIIGSRFDDVLRTSNGASWGGAVTTVRGHDGNDRLYSQYSVQNLDLRLHLLFGDAGDDQLYGAPGTVSFGLPLIGEVLNGGAGNDRFWDVPDGTTSATKQAGAFAGEDGNDSFYFAASNVTGEGHLVDGGAGFDTVDYSQYGTSLSLNLATSGLISNVEGVRGTVFDDVVTGDDQINALVGFEGDDSLAGGGGDDKIHTGAGDDTASGGAGNDLIFAAEGSNHVEGGSGTDMLSFDAQQSGEERKSTPGWTPQETLGRVDADIRTGSATFIEPDDGPSYVTTFERIENLTGGWLSDTLRGDFGDNVISGGAQLGADMIEGRLGNDTLAGGDGDDTLYGDSTDAEAAPLLAHVEAVSFNRVDETQQAAVLDVFDMPTDTVTVELLFRANDGVIPASYMSFFSYAAGTPVDQEEFLIFGYTNAFSQTLGIRVNGNNFLSDIPTASILDGDAHRLSGSYDGASGAVALYLDGAEIAGGITNAGGLAANGRVVIAQDQDSDGLFRDRKTMKGDIADVRVWDTQRSADDIEAQAFANSLDPLSHPDLVANWVPDAAQPTVIQDVIAGADLQLLGSPEIRSLAEGDDVLDGGAGHDFLAGGSGDDLLQGGDGNDNLRGGAGADVVQGDGGNDVLLGGSENDVLSGGAGEDVLFAGAGSDLAFGGAGFDRIFGGSGADRLFGGADNDIVNGGADNDIINTGSGNDLIFAQKGNDLVFSQSGNDNIFGGAGNDKLFGGEGNDQINGGAGHDEIFGGAGSDQITGAAGDDLMVGGGGADVFYLNAAQGADRITDYTAIDVLDIASFGLTDSAGSDQDWRDATAAVGSSGGGADVTITWAAGGSLTIENMGVGALSDADFAF